MEVYCVAGSRLPTKSYDFLHLLMNAFLTERPFDLEEKQRKKKKGLKNIFYYTKRRQAIP